MKQRIIFSLFSLAIIFLVSVACQKDYESILDPTSKTVMTSDAKASEEASLRRRRCVCPDVYAPVCGDDGVTYTNSCAADCEGVRYRQGHCDLWITE